MIKGPRCKICRSVHRADIDKMLHKGVPLSKIIEKAKKFKPSFKVNKANLSVHNKKHRIPSIVEGTPDRKAEDVTTRQQLDTAQDVMLCTEIIKDVLSRIRSKTLIPTITEALKAAEILKRIQDGNPWENALRAFVSEVSLEHGFRN